MSYSINVHSGDMPVRIAMADSHGMFRSSVKQQLRQLGFHVSIDAANGADLIRMLEADPQRPDICILDINIQPLNGFDTAGIIRDKWPELRILVLTSLSEQAYVIRMVSSGARGYLLKTESIEHLRDAILSLYRNGVYFSPSMPGTMYRRIINGEMKLPRLSRLERDVLYYSCSDLSYETIGEILGTSKRSIESARDRLFCKFAVSSRVSLALLAVRLGYVPLENIPCRLI